ncbi:hypothetical protein HU200_024184 [Digitaria exilis]|uniref:WRKY domain-containing protein n=1 Tax=Digitaria exilis TaxID=1010633 RepID=A0A835EVZ3_9POAL|nr:hypothetical protein HU200_024184 [Digitaria exilis]
MPGGSASAACGVMAEAQEAAVRLLGLLQSTGADPAKQQLAQQIICCINRALDKVRDDVGAGDGSKGKPEQGLAAARPPTEYRRRARGCGEARERVVSSTMDDGYAWRKYGEKSIQHQRHPRFYFRCGYRNELGCRARKQVERMEDDPSLFHTAYFGDHTPACPRADAAVLTSSHDGSRPCLPAEAGEELPANMVEFAAQYWPPKDQLVNSSSEISFASPGGMESESSLEANLEELLHLL